MDVDLQEWSKKMNTATSQPLHRRMMRLHILSDLHIEFGPFEPPATSADVIILAGDIHVGINGLAWAKEKFPNKDVIYVLGNHEFYGEAIPKLVLKLKVAARGSNVHILDNESLLLDGVRFLGCTMWTDFNLFGDPRIAGSDAAQTMTDFKRIRVSPEYRKLRSIDTAIFHRSSVNWLKRELSIETGAKTVVVTHHAPSARSIPEEIRTDLLSAGYASNLEDVVESSRASLWIHGHIHSRSEYTIGTTRVLCNPRGYAEEETPDFAADYVVEL